jgi:hypothetical protein
MNCTTTCTASALQSRWRSVGLLSGFRHQHWLGIQLAANPFQIPLEAPPSAGIRTTNRDVHDQPRIRPSAEKVFSMEGT